MSVNFRHQKYLAGFKYIMVLINIINMFLRISGQNSFWIQEGANYFRSQSFITIAVLSQNINWSNNRLSILLLHMKQNMQWDFRPVINDIIKHLHNYGADNYNKTNCEMLK